MLEQLLIKVKLAHRPKVCLFRSLSSQEKIYILVSTGWIGVRGQQEVERSGPGSFRRTYSHSRRTNTGATLKCCYARTVQNSVQTARVRKLCETVFLLMTDIKYRWQISMQRWDKDKSWVKTNESQVQSKSRPSEDEYVLVLSPDQQTSQHSWVQNNLYQSSRVFLDFRFMTCLSDSPLLWSELCLDFYFYFLSVETCSEFSSQT